MKSVGDDIHLRMNYFKRALPVKLRPPPPPVGPPPPSLPSTGKVVLFRTSKTTFKRVLQILVQIDYENYDCDDDNGDYIDDYDNENNKKPRQIPWSKYTPFRHNYLFKK